MRLGEPAADLVFGGIELACARQRLERRIELSELHPRLAEDIQDRHARGTLGGETLEDREPLCGLARAEKVLGAIDPIEESEHAPRIGARAPHGAAPCARGRRVAERAKPRARLVRELGRSLLARAEPFGRA